MPLLFYRFHSLLKFKLHWRFWRSKSKPMKNSLRKAKCVMARGWFGDKLW